MTWSVSLVVLFCVSIFVSRLTLKERTLFVSAYCFLHMIWRVSFFSLRLLHLFSSCTTFFLYTEKKVLCVSPLILFCWLLPLKTSTMSQTMRTKMKMIMSWEKDKKEKRHLQGLLHLQLTISLSPSLFLFLSWCSWFASERRRFKKTVSPCLCTNFIVSAWQSLSMSLLLVLSHFVYPSFSCLW